MSYSEAKKALRLELRKISFDANMYDRFGAEYPYAVQCSIRRKAILKELETLEKKGKKSYARQQSFFNS